MRDLALIAYAATESSPEPVQNLGEILMKSELFVGTDLDLGPKCLQRLLAVNTSRQS